MRSEFAFLFPPVKKVRKPRAAAAKAIKVGATVELKGHIATVVERDTRYKNALFVEVDGKRSPYSFSRDMMKVL